MGRLLALQHYRYSTGRAARLVFYMFVADGALSVYREVGDALRGLVYWALDELRDLDEIVPSVRAMRIETSMDIPCRWRSSCPHHGA